MTPWCVHGIPNRARCTARAEGAHVRIPCSQYSLETVLLDPSISPPSGATFDYGQHDGRGYEHCYSGNHGLPNSLGRLTINARVLPQMAARMVQTAPPGADLRWSRY